MINLTLNLGSLKSNSVLVPVHLGVKDLSGEKCGKDWCLKKCGDILKVYWVIRQSL